MREKFKLWLFSHVYTALQSTQKVRNTLILIPETHGAVGGSMIFDHQTSIWMCWHLKAMLGPTSAEVLWQRNRRVDLQKKFSPVSTFVRQDAAVANKTQESAQSWQITFYWPHNGWDNRQSPLSRFWYIIRLQTSNGFESQTRTSWFVFQVALVPEAARAGLFSVPWSCLKQSARQLRNLTIWHA